MSLHPCFYLIFTATLSNRYYCHFADDETETNSVTARLRRTQLQRGIYPGPSPTPAPPTQTWHRQRAARLRSGQTWLASVTACAGRGAPNTRGGCPCAMLASACCLRRERRAPAVVPRADLSLSAGPQASGSRGSQLKAPTLSGHPSPAVLEPRTRTGHLPLLLAPSPLPLQLSAQHPQR